MFWQLLDLLWNTLLNIAVWCGGWRCILLAGLVFSLVYWTCQNYLFEHGPTKIMLGSQVNAPALFFAVLTATTLFMWMQSRK